MASPDEAAGDSPTSGAKATTQAPRLARGVLRPRGGRRRRGRGLGPVRLAAARRPLGDRERDAPGAAIGGPRRVRRRAGHAADPGEHRPGGGADRADHAGPQRAGHQVLAEPAGHRGAGADAGAGPAGATAAGTTWPTRTAWCCSGSPGAPRACRSIRTVAPEGALRGDPDLAAAAAVLGELPAQLRHSVTSVTAPHPDQVTLRLAGGVTVLWGDTSRAADQGAGTCRPHAVALALLRRECAGVRRGQVTGRMPKTRQSATR